MDRTVKKMEAQLTQWRSKIDKLAARVPAAGGEPRFDALLHIDELKALHAIAQARFDEFKAAKDAERQRCQDVMNRAWNELEGAFKNPRPSA
jgi:hypothetical protein